MSYINLLIRLAKEPRGEGKAFPLILCVYIYIHTIYTAVKSNYFPIIVIIIFQIHKGPGNKQKTHSAWCGTSRILGGDRTQIL